VGGGYDMAGVTIANAVRLEAAGRPGTLLIDVASYEALAQEFPRADRFQVWCEPKS
jgi:hypothetical protein